MNPQKKIIKNLPMGEGGKMFRKYFLVLVLIILGLALSFPSPSYNGEIGGEGVGTQISEFLRELPAVPAGETCLLGQEPKHSCTQGANGLTHKGLWNGLDLGLVGTLWDGGFRAPKFCDQEVKNCRVTLYEEYPCRGNPKGGGMQLLFEATSNEGVQYTFLLVHVRIGQGLKEGDYVVSGQQVAKVDMKPPPTDLGSGNTCWTGAHLHLEVWVNGKATSPCALLRAFHCNLDDCNNGDFDEKSSCEIELPPLLLPARIREKFE